MEIKYTDELRNEIIKCITEGLINSYGYDIEMCNNIINSSEIEKSIKLTPDIICHYSQEYLVDMVMIIYLEK